MAGSLPLRNRRASPARCVAGSCIGMRLSVFSMLARCPVDAKRHLFKVLVRPRCIGGCKELRQVRHGTRRARVEASRAAIRFSCISMRTCRRNALDAPSRSVSRRKKVDTHGDEPTAGSKRQPDPSLPFSAETAHACSQRFPWALGARHAALCSPGLPSSHDLPMVVEGRNVQAAWARHGCIRH